MLRQHRASELRLLAGTFHSHLQPDRTMRTPVLPIAALLVVTAQAKAQLHAGEVPSGMSAVDVNIDIFLPTPNTTNSATFEVDCDDQPDMMVELVHGQPAVDAPNVAMLHLMDADLELCADLATFQRPKYYAVEQLLDCAGDFDWQSGIVNVLGDFGSFTAIGPTSIDSMYVAYRRGAQVGWILLSFEVIGNVGPSLQVHQVLPICPGTTSIGSHDPAPALGLFPNPGNGGPIRVQSAEVVESIEVLDAAGRSLAWYSGNPRTIAAPEVAGTYLVRAINADGRRSITRLVRY